MKKKLTALVLFFVAAAMFLAACNGNGYTPDPEPTTYTITYNLPTGAVHSNPTTFTSETVLPIALTPASLEGHTFDGWFNSVTGGTQVTAITATGNITLWGRFTEDGYAINFRGIVAQDTNNNPVRFFEEDLEEGSITLAPASRSGWDFLGWFDGAEDGNEVTEIEETGEVTVYARWQMINGGQVRSQPDYHRVTNTVAGLTRDSIAAREASPYSSFVRERFTPENGWSAAGVHPDNTQGPGGPPVNRHVGVDGNRLHWDIGGPWRRATNNVLGHAHAVIEIDEDFNTFEIVVDGHDGGNHGGRVRVRAVDTATFEIFTLLPWRNIPRGPQVDIYIQGHIPYALRGAAALILIEADFSALHHTDLLMNVNVLRFFEETNEEELFIHESISSFNVFTPGGHQGTNVNATLTRGHINGLSVSTRTAFEGAHFDEWGRIGRFFSWNDALGTDMTPAGFAAGYAQALAYNKFDLNGFDTATMTVNAHEYAAAYNRAGRVRVRFVDVSDWTIHDISEGWIDVPNNMAPYTFVFAIPADLNGATVLALIEFDHYSLTEIVYGRYLCVTVSEFKFS